MKENATFHLLAEENRKEENSLVAHLRVIRVVWRLSRSSNLQLTQNYGIAARKDPELSDFANLRCDSTEPYSALRQRCQTTAVCLCT